MFVSHIPYPCIQELIPYNPYWLAGTTTPLLPQITAQTFRLVSGMVLGGTAPSGSVSFSSAQDFLSSELGLLVVNLAATWTDAGLSYLTTVHTKDTRESTGKRRPGLPAQKKGGPGRGW